MRRCGLSTIPIQIDFVRYTISKLEKVLGNQETIKNSLQSSLFCKRTVKKTEWLGQNILVLKKFTGDSLFNMLNKTVNYP